jgi:hypothetical protein
MRLIPFVLTSLLLLAAPALAAARGESLVAVELYTSQGCGGCMEASDYAAELAQRKGVLLLSFGVDYWDYLGWRDTSAKPEFAERQRRYIAGPIDNPKPHPFTPQMIVDGHFNGEALNRKMIDLAIYFCIKNGHVAHSPPIETRRNGGQITVSIGDGDQLAVPGDVLLVAYEPGEHDVAVDAGENAHKVMKTYNVVRNVSHIGMWSGDPVSLSAPIEPGVSYAVLVQKPAQGAMIAAVMESAPGG